MRSGSNARSTTTTLTSDTAVSLPSAPLPNSTTETRSSAQVSFNSATKSDNTVSTWSGTPSSRTTGLSAITSSPRANPAAATAPALADSYHRNNRGANEWPRTARCCPLVIVCRRLLRGGHGAGVLGDASGLGERGELLLRIAVGLDHAGRHEQLGGRLDRDIEFDDLAPRHVEEETGGRIRRARHEHRHVLLLGRELCRDVGARRRRQEHQRPHAGRRKLDQPDLAERRARLGEQRLEHLLEAAVDRPHDRHALENALAHLDQGAADQVGGEKPEQGQRHEGNDEAESGKLDRQVSLGPISERDEGADEVVDPGHERPYQVERDGDWPGHHQAGEEIGANAAADAMMMRRRGGGGRRLGRNQVGIVCCHLPLTLCAFTRRLSLYKFRAGSSIPRSRISPDCAAGRRRSP